MSRNLKHGVGRGIHNPLAGFQLLRAIIPDDLGAGVGQIAQNAPAGSGLEGLQHLPGEAMGIGGQGLRRHHACDFPVADGGVLAHGGFCQPGHRPGGIWLLPQEGQALDVPQSGLSQIGDLQGLGPGTGPQGMHPHVPKLCRVRHRPSAAGVQHNQKNPFHSGHLHDVPCLRWNCTGRHRRLFIAPSSLPLPALPSSCR